MRVLLVAALVFVAALAGCSGKKGDDDAHYLCSNGVELHQDDYEEIPSNFTEDQVIDFLKGKCPKSSGSGSKTNTTSSAPNLPPVLKLNVTDSGGNVTNVTVKNGNLTFDATGSFDPDGTVSAIAISVKDSNQTRTRQLYDAVSKKFTPATFTFDRPGVVNVSIAMVDDRAGFNTTLTKAYVNDPQTVVGGSISAPASDAPSQLADPCKGASGTLNDQGPLVDSGYFKKTQFVVVPGATYIEAMPAADTLVTICDPALNPVSETKSAGPVVTSNQPIVAPAGTDSYVIGFYADGANVDAQALVIVHYDPQPAAAA